MAAVTATATSGSMISGSISKSEEVGTWAEARVGELMGLVNAATAELVSVIAKVIDAEAWDGTRSPEHWVTWRAGVSPSRARSLVRSARRMGDLPVMAGAFSEGRLTEDSVGLLSTHISGERDAEATAWAQVMTITQLRRILSALPEVDPSTPDPDEPQARPEPELGEVSFANDTDGWGLRAKGLPAELGALVQKALEAARDAEFSDRHPEVTQDTKSTGVTWTDALVRMARAALDSLDPTSGNSVSQRYQVIVHVGQQDHPAAHLHLGPALSDAARRRITCDTNLRWLMEHEGKPVGWGRMRRSVGPVLRRIIEDRDRGCRVPGCSQVRWCEVHHLVHVEDGGTTVPENLALLCPGHHDHHHRALLGIEGDPTTPDGLIFKDRHGRVMKPPQPTPPGQPSPDAATRMGINAATFTPPLGEPLYGKWFDWN